MLGGAGGNHLWLRKTGFFLEGKRWYPTVTLTANGDALVTGGYTDDSNPPGVIVRDNYEVWNTSIGQYRLKLGTTTQIFNGPSLVHPEIADPLWVYPRMAQLGTGEVFMAGMYDQAVALWHDNPQMQPYYGPEKWDLRGSSAPDYREYGTMVVFPNINAQHTDAVMILGGRQGPFAMTFPPPSTGPWQ